MKEKDQDRSIFKEILGWLVYIAILLAAVYVLITYVGQRTEVSGHSMEPTLQHGDNLIVDKISYRFREPERYEIIVFPYQYKENTYYIKRIIGLPGETVQIIDGEVYINGELLADEHYGKEVMIRGLQQNRSHWETMNILFWVTIEITVLTAGIRV